MTFDKDKLAFMFFMQKVEKDLKSIKEGEEKISITMGKEYWQRIVNAYTKLIKQEERFQEIRVLANKLRFFENNYLDYDEERAMLEKEKEKK